MPTPPPAGYVHVAAAAVRDPRGRVLIARRDRSRHQGGLWEFPGGKVEAGESVAAALARELHEELGIVPQQAAPLIQIAHRYRDKAVFLDVWEVTAFRGEPHGREGQPVRWVAADELGAYPFPAANRPIVTALRLPRRYLITPEPGPEGRWSGFLAGLEAALATGTRMVQLRSKALPVEAMGELAREVAALCDEHSALLCLNGPADLWGRFPERGIHLTGAQLDALAGRPSHPLVGASCHDAGQLRHAHALGLDFAVLSPVQATTSHPGATPLGWARFAALVREAALPVYALGGVRPADLDTARAHGAQGIAAIRALWPDGA